MQRCQQFKSTTRWPCVLRAEGGGCCCTPFERGRGEIFFSKSEPFPPFVKQRDSQSDQSVHCSIPHTLISSALSFSSSWHRLFRAARCEFACQEELLFNLSNQNYHYIIIIDIGLTSSLSSNFNLVF